jgi:hypothetical protein
MRPHIREIDAPLPPKAGSRDHWRLTLAGWLDRWRYRKLADHADTHFTLRLRAQYDDGCAAVDQWLARSETRLKLRLAAIGQLTAEHSSSAASNRLKLALGLKRRLDAELASLPAAEATAKARWLRHYEGQLARYTRARMRGFVAPQTEPARLPRPDAPQPETSARHIRAA